MFRAKLAVTPEQAQWLQSSFDLLATLFGEEWILNAPLVLPNEHFFPKKYEATEEWARYAFDRVRDLMKVPETEIFLEFISDPWDELREAKVPIAPRTSGAAGTHQTLKINRWKNRCAHHDQAKFIEGTGSHGRRHVARARACIAPRRRQNQSRP